MRILHLVTRSQRRGAELVAVELARGLDALGHSNQVFALGLGFDGSVDAALTPLTTRTDTGLLTVARAARALRRQLVREPVDIVMAHGGRAVEAAVLVRRRGRPTVVWQRILGFPPEVWRPIPRLRWRAVVRRIDAAVALTGELGAELERLGFDGPIWTIPNFRDPRPFDSIDREQARSRLRAELALPADVALIGFVGHLIEQKRPDRALATLVAVRDQGVPAHLVVAGDGPLRRELEKAVADLGLAGCVHLLGDRRDVAQILAALDVFVLTSDAEGLPGVLIEAQMAGCPIVTVPFGGVRDLIDDGRTGMIVDHLDHRELAQRVVGLLRDPDLRARLGSEARRRSGRFSLETAAATYAARLAELASGPPKSR